MTPSEVPYNTLKAALIDAFGKTQAQKDQDILNINGLGDKKPSELLQHMNNLNADPKTLFKALFLAQLPPEVRQILALSDKTDIKDLAKEADRIMEVSQLSNTSQVNSTSGFRKSGGRNPDYPRGPNILSPSQTNNGHFSPAYVSTIQSLVIGQDPVSLPANFIPFRGQENAPPFRGRETPHPVDSKQLVDRCQQSQPVDRYQHLRLLNGTQYASLGVQGQQFPSPCV